MVKLEIELPDDFWNELVADAKRNGISEEEIRVVFQDAISEMMRIVPEFTGLRKMGMPEPEIALRQHMESMAIVGKKFSALWGKKLQEGREE